MAAKKRRGKPNSNGSSSQSSLSPSSSSSSPTSSVSVSPTKPKKQEDRNKNVFRIIPSCLCLVVVFALFALTPPSSIASSSEQNVEECLTADGENACSLEEEKEEEEEDREKLFAGERYKVLQVIPHKHTSSLFTQGLTYDNGKLYEGTGLHGESALYELNPSTGTILNTKTLHSRYFGEGISFFHDQNNEPRIIQITWQEKTGFIYNADTFDLVREFQYKTSTSEGWGITYNEELKEFIVSDGSSNLMFWDRDTLEEKRRVQVKVPNVDSEGRILTRGRGGRPVNHLNELEFNKGHVLANVWYNDVILKIDPSTGSVTKIYDFKNLYKDRVKEADCFNGISVSDVDGEFFVTGKLWPSIYRIKLLD